MNWKASPKDSYSVEFGHVDDRDSSPLLLYEANRHGNAANISVYFKEVLGKARPYFNLLARPVVWSKGLTVRQ